MEPKRTIEEVLDLKTGQLLSASDFFNKPFDELIRLRSEIDSANQGLCAKLIVCSVCGEHIRMLGGKSSQVFAKSRNFHFAHLHNSKDCPIKTTSKHSREDINRMKYRGAPESFLHQDLKAKIAEGLNRNKSLKGQVSEVNIEKVIRSLDDKEWKKPDISAVFNNSRIAIELQLSTTWLDVITKRQHFYKEQKIFILWVFHSFESSDDFRRLTKSDIIYTNNNNAFTFGPEEYKHSLAKNDLRLKCNYLEYYADEDRVRSKWRLAEVSLAELTFNTSSYQVYYFDSLTSKLNAEKDVEAYLAIELKREREEQIIRQKRIYEKQDLEADLKKHLKIREAIDDEIKALEKNSNESVLRSGPLKTRIEGLRDETRQLFLRLSAPVSPYVTAPVNLTMIRLHEDLKVLMGNLKQLNEARYDLLKKVQNIKPLEEKNVSGRSYRVLDKIRHWEYIQSHQKDLWTFHLTQEVSLFSIPKVDRIVSHQLEQLKFNKNIVVMADLDDDLNAYEQKLKEVDLQLAVEKEHYNQFEESFNLIIYQELYTHFSGEMEGIDSELMRNAKLKSDKEHKLAIQNSLIKSLKTRLREYFYVDDE